MDEQNSPKTSRSNETPARGLAGGIVRSLFGLERREAQERQFSRAVEIIRNHEIHATSGMDEATRELYDLWAQSFEQVKAEFNDVFDLFQQMEKDLPGWFCVSPNLAPWKSVNTSRGGYTFAVCMMKNHHRHAPLSEKSLSVSFGLDELPVGVGDERIVGRTAPMNDSLVGLEQCTGKSLRDRYAGAKVLADQIQGRSLVFRLNHRHIGQQTTRLPLSTLNQRTLRELCQGLFILLNNDVLSQLQSSIASPERLLLACSEAAQSNC